MNVTKILDSIASGQLPEIFIESTKLAVISTIDSIFKEKPTYMGIQKNEKPFDGIAGIIAFVGDVAWSVTLSLPLEIADAMVYYLKGIKSQYHNDKMGDIVVEFINTIAGKIITQLKSIPIKLDKSLPTVARGQNMKMLFSDKHPSIQIGFNCLMGKFQITMAIEKSRKDSH